MTDAGLKELAGLALDDLYLPLQCRTGQGLKNYLAALGPKKSLNLSGWKISDTDLGSLAGRDLKGLSIPDNAKTDLGLEYYLAALSHADTLNLSVTGRWHLSRLPMGKIACMERLRSLDLRGQKVTDADLKTLGRMTNLERLGLATHPA